jgi:hypothetical protein
MASTHKKADASASVTHTTNGVEEEAGRLLHELKCCIVVHALRSVERVLVGTEGQRRDGDGDAGPSPQEAHKGTWL